MELEDSRADISSISFGSDLTPLISTPVNNKSKKQRRGESILGSLDDPRSDVAPSRSLDDSSNSGGDPFANISISSAGSTQGLSIHGEGQGSMGSLLNYFSLFKKMKIIFLVNMQMMPVCSRYDLSRSWAFFVCIQIQRNISSSQVWHGQRTDTPRWYDVQNNGRVRTAK